MNDKKLRIYRRAIEAGYDYAIELPTEFPAENTDLMIFHAMKKFCAFAEYDHNAPVSYPDWEKPHYKATFFAYLIISLVEYWIFRKKVTERAPYWYARLTAAIFAPWLVFLTWYAMAALVGRLPIGLEILYGNLATLLVGILATVFERGFEQISYGKPLRSVIWTLFVLSILVYILLTFRLPWADVFTEPDWQGHSLWLAKSPGRGKAFTTPAKARRR